VLIAAPAPVLAADIKLAPVLVTDGRNRAGGGGDRTVDYHLVVVGDRGDGSGRLGAGGGDRSGGREIMAADPSVRAAGTHMLAAPTAFLREDT